MPAPRPFALGTFRSGDRPFAGLVRDGRVRRLEASTRDLLADWQRCLPTLVDQGEGEGEWLDLAQLEVLAPVEPRQIFQSGANFRAHVIDLAVAHRDIAGGRTPAEVRAQTAAMMDERARNGTPYIFTGLPSAVAGPYDDLVLPDYSDQHDWELELTAVIGAPAFRVDPGTALQHVAAYTICNDVTTRDLVFRADLPAVGTDWFRAKNAPGFLPLGPFLVPAAFVDDPMDLQITLTLNGHVMQDESTKDMIFDVATLVSAASQITRLMPGDLVLTGSPAGNGMHWKRLLRDGDVMESSITGLGTQRVRCRSEASS